MKARFAILAAACAAILCSCASAPAEIPADAPARILVQRAQEAMDKYDYDEAVRYYVALKERYGEDPAYLCTADYEIAFIAYKQDRFAEAKLGLEELLARYAAPGGASLPPHFKILAEKVLEQIEAKTAAPAK
ncbi:MAG TPA: hypothetical protein PLB91_16095 [Spirochaetales bacterium]|nr:hypothetical protein [Spirochaetales bacterium]HRY54040.1 hypothetical protein [Spirochaetia bacterium]HRZ63420.1 hypothetical protein [Spirochaetia bacterium]